MNKTFKVVFNRARGALMVANEVTSSMQKKGTKTAIALGVSMMLASGAAFAEEITYEQSSGDAGWKSVGSAESVLAEGDTLLMNITGKNDTRAYGLLASGDGKVYTNKGTIKVNTATGDDAAQAWRVKGMMSQDGGTVVNEGTIAVTNAYGMTVGSMTAGKTNTIINKGTITVTGGAGIEAAPTGTQAEQGKAKASVDNQGTITVTDNKSTGIVVSGNNGVIKNSGTIDASKSKAIVVQKESDYEAKNNSITFAKGSTTKGMVYVGPGVEGTTLTFEDGASFDGSVFVATEKSVKAKGTKLTGTNLRFENKSRSLGSGIYFYDADDSEISLTNVDFVNNSATWGGAAIYTYAKNFKHIGGTYSGNTTISTGVKASNGTVKDGANGGALFIKGNESVVFTDVVFTNNSAVAKKTEDSEGGYAYGGALLVDYSTGANSGVERASEVKFVVTEGKDLVYSGNTVSSDSTAQSFDTSGYHVSSAAAGGFLFLDRGAAAEFNIANDAKLTIGEARVTGETDSIASSIPNTNTTVNSGKHAAIVKTGAGELVINSSLNKYFGTVKVSAGTLTVNSDWTINNAVTVDGGTLAAEKFSFATDATTSPSLTLNGGTLKTGVAKVFTDATLKSESFTKKDKITLTSGTLAVTDSGEYTTAFAEKLVAALGDKVSLTIVNAKLAVADEKDAKLISGVIQEKASVNVAVGEATSVSLGTSTANVTTGAQTIVLDKSADVTVNNLTVVGKADGSAFIENAKTVKVAENATLNLGSAEAEAATSGSLPEVTLAKTATLNVTNTVVTTKSLTGGESVKINLGTTEAAGVLHTEKLALNGAMIFLDPAWQDGSTISDASSFSAVTVDNLNGTIVAGQSSVVALGATKDAAVSGFNKLAQTNSLTWGSDGITAGLYIGTPLTLTPETSKILVNGLLTTAPTSVDAGLTIASNGILMVDQSGIGSNKAVSGVEKVTIAGDATVAVINAKGDTTLKLADAVSISGYTEGEEPATKTVLTDNPFVKGTLTASSGTIALSDYADETGINVIASMGVQSMIRHADAVLAETIADRGAEVTTGNGLWVSVRGERFEQKKLGGGAGFHANMGYGAFGAEFTPTDATSLGVAFQYGFGTVKGKLYSAKNKTKDYGITLYGSTLLGDTGVKLLGEVSYTKSTNDLTNNYFTGLNQDLDAKMISGGITAQKHFAAGSFDLVPSVGVRVSRITTDAMKAGESRIAKEKQTIVQVPVALRVNAKVIETEGGWAITPRFKVAFVPTFGDKEIKIFGAEKTVLDTTPVQGTFGVSFVKGNFTIDATANLGVSNKDTSSIGGKVGLSYRF